MNTEDPKDVVRRGYDLVSTAYRSDHFQFEGSGYAKYLGWLRPHIPERARVLDIGCGCGVPVARELASLGCEVLGVDVSETQVARARRLVPGAEFICADIMRQKFPASSFDAVVAFYSIIHLPLTDHEPILSRIGDWTSPGGVFLGTVGPDDSPGYVEEDWLAVKGAKMYWSHAGPESYRTWLSAARFDLLREDVLVDSDGSRHPVIFALKGGP